MKQTNKESQTINCTVTSCKYNNGQRQLCELEHIIVTPVQGCQTTQPDESMCSSYKNIDNNKQNKKEIKKLILMTDFDKLFDYNVIL